LFEAGSWAELKEDTMGLSSLGIEHPLVAVRDLDAVAARWEALGFAPRPLGRHPWGTVNRMIMFANQFIELIAVEDEAAGRHVFGRLITEALKRGEGVAALALHSADAAADAAAIEARGGWSAGVVEVRREVGEAVMRASLAVLPDDDFPDLAVLLCQQHTPELVWRPEWLAHPNGADALSAVFILAPHPDRLAARLATIWGAASVAEQPGGLLVETATGALHVLDETALLRRFSGARLPVGASRRAPCVVALSVHTRNFSAAVIRAMQLPGVRVEDGQHRRILVPASYAGGVILELHG
jgi:hypothetical protein